MLRDIFKDDIANHIIDFEEYSPYPRCSDREAWDKIPKKYTKAVCEKAEGYLEHEFKPISASIYQYTGQTDDLSLFDKVRGANLLPLQIMTIAECIENKGRYMRQILDGIWWIMDEASWYRPWASPMAKKFPSAVIDVTDSVIELAASSTVHILALIYYLFKDQFDEIDENIHKRIYSEIDRRIFIPYLEKDDHWWMAYYRHYHSKMGVLYSINNFTPHCTNLVLEAFLLIEKNPVKRGRAVEKTMEVLDNYINFVADDGWCDEGNGYWFMSNGSLNLVLEKIKAVTNNYVNVFDNEKIFNMGQYLCNAHIGNGYFVNFSDCHTTNKMMNSKAIQYALNTKNDKLMKLAFDVADKESLLESITTSPIGFDMSLFVFFNYKKINNQYGVTLDVKDYIQDEHYYKDSEVLIVRENEKSYRGIYMACKGGHNDENHNHNDAGNFIIYKDSVPVLIDPGVESYIADTFNTNRYKLWTMQSKYHNLPTFNDVMQKETRRYKARHVKYLKDKNNPGLSMSLKNAYGVESGLVKFNRTVTFNRVKNEVTCNDDIVLSKMSSEVEFSFMTPCRTVDNDGVIEFYNEDKKIAHMSYNSNLFTYDIEEISFRCERLKDEWGGYLQRIILKVKKPVKELNPQFVVS